jgi:hypothetical protein
MNFIRSNGNVNGNKNKNKISQNIPSISTNQAVNQSRNTTNKNKASINIPRSTHTTISNINIVPKVSPNVIVSNQNKIKKSTRNEMIKVTAAAVNNKNQNVIRRVASEEFIRNVFTFTSQLKLYHWQTRSYARHIETDHYLEELQKLVDKFIETNGIIDNAIQVRFFDFSINPPEDFKEFTMTGRMLDNIANGIITAPLEGEEETKQEDPFAKFLTVL